MTTTARHAADTEPPLTETVATEHGSRSAHGEDDVVSDPALDDRLGSDWSDEGGATQSGPATSAPADDPA